MSRAFVKDGDDRPERPAPRPVGDGPNYVTQAGLEDLRAKLERARADGDERNTAYYEERLARSVVRDVAEAPSGEVAFGSTVVARDADGKEMRMRIVGEDESDPLHGAIAWNAPFAQAVLGHHVGERVTVRRPAGPLVLTIERIEMSGKVS